MKLDDFIDEVGKDSLAPGGGSVAALAGSLGSGLGCMVTSLTPAKKGFENTLEPLSKRGRALVANMEKLKRVVDEDTEAFNDVISAMRMPKNTPEEKNSRDEAIEKGYKKATLVPFETAKLCVSTIEELLEVAEKGNPSSVSDVGVGALMAYAGFEGAILNVRINLPNIKDDSFKKDITDKIEDLRTKATKGRDKILEAVNEKIGK